jgi:hypothetical protein
MKKRFLWLGNLQILNVNQSPMDQYFMPDGAKLGGATTRSSLFGGSE